MITVANIAHSVASVDYSVDTSPLYRNYEPLCYGCYPPGPKGDGLFVSAAVFALGFVTAKLVAVSTLGFVSPASLALMLVSENVALLLVRMAFGNWRWFNPAGDSTAFSLIFHFLVLYPISIAAPIPIFRHPFFLSPCMYLGLIVWSLFASNPLMLALAFHFYDEPISQWVVWAVLGSASALSVFSALIAFVLMKPSFRGTFYRHRTMAKHAREYYWVRRTKWDGTPIMSNDDLDAVRAQSLAGYAMVYWPADLAREWVREGWAGWLSNPPDWFTKKWKARIPEEWFEGGEGDDAVSLTTQEANFRHTVGQAPPWNLNSRDLESYFNDQFVNSSSLSLAESEKKKRRHLSHLVAGAGSIGFLERCCTSHTKSPWVRISNAVDGKPLRVDDECVKQLTSFLCSKGFSFYYRLYVTSDALSKPLHEYTLVKPVQHQEHMEHLLCRNRQTKQPTVLSFGSSEYFPITQDVVAGILGVCETSEFVASIYKWGPSGPVVFVFGEHCGGGPLAARIKPCIGIEDSEEFWRIALQLAQGLSDIHRAGLVRMAIQVGRVTQFFFKR